MSVFGKPKEITALVSVDEVYPVFNLVSDMKSGPVQIQTTQSKVNEWNKATIAYKKAQSEIEKLVNYYEPIAAKTKKPSKE